MERLQLQSRVWEPSGRRLLAEIGDGRGGRAVDIGCGVMGWLGLLSEWVGQDGEVVGTDIDDAMLCAAEQFVADEGLGNVTAPETTISSPPGWSPHPSTWCTRGSSSPRWVVAHDQMEDLLVRLLAPRAAPSS